MCFVKTADGIPTEFPLPQKLQPELDHQLHPFDFDQLQPIPQHLPNLNQLIALNNHLFANQYLPFPSLFPPTPPMDDSDLFSDSSFHLPPPQNPTPQRKSSLRKSVQAKPSTKLSVPYNTLSVEEKRARNTEAARRSREKKQSTITFLQSRIKQLESESTHLKVNLAVLENEQKTWIDKEQAYLSSITALQAKLGIQN